MKQYSASASIDGKAKRVLAIAQAAVLVASSLVPMLFMSRASAAQLTDRFVRISTSVSDATGVQYDFGFDLGSNTVIQGVIFEFCDAPLGTCTLPTGMNVNRTLTTLDGDTGFQGGANAFAEFATDDTGDCDDIDGSSDDTMYCINDADGGSTTAGSLTVDLGAITNPTANETVYIRISLYSDDDFQSGDLVHNGTVAAAIVDQLTVNGRVQERLDFCVAAVDDAAALPANVAACAGITDQNVDLGVITESAVAVTPVDADVDTGSDDDYGVLMVNTNAANGTVLTYFAEPQASVLSGDTDQLRSFRVVPTDCDALSTSIVDQCFQSAAGTETTITSGTERFGVYIPCVDTTQGSSSNVVVPDDYDGNDDTETNSADCENETFTSGTAQIAWNSTSTAATLATSPSTIDDEIVKLRFAATASPTTPSGNYTVTTTYIATVTF